MTFTGLLADRAAKAHLSRTLPAVGYAPNIRQADDRDQLLAISRDPKRNPLNYLQKQSQFNTNTCAANAGTNGMETLGLYSSEMRNLTQLSRMFLYLHARWQFAGNMADEGTSIQSIIDVLQSIGICTEALFPWGQWARDKRHLDSLCTPQILTDAATRKLTSWTEATDDFDATVARVLLRDPVLWGTDWPFPNGPYGHATLIVWAEWSGSDWILKGFNSHEGNYIFNITRSNYRYAIHNSPFGAYHLQGTKDLRFDPNTDLVL